MYKKYAGFHEAITIFFIRMEKQKDGQINKNMCNLHQKNDIIMSDTELDFFV